MNITGLSGRINRVQYNYKDQYRMEFKNVALGRINRVFLLETVRGFAETTKVAVIVMR